MKCLLHIYDHKGKLIKELLCNTIYEAVKNGYKSLHDFNVIEAPGNSPRLYWAGRKDDQYRSDFNQWEMKAKVLDAKYEEL